MGPFLRDLLLHLQVGRESILGFTGSSTINCKGLYLPCLQSEHPAIGGCLSKVCGPFQLSHHNDGMDTWVQPSPDYSVDQLVGFSIWEINIYQHFLHSISFSPNSPTISCYMGPPIILYGTSSKKY